MDCKSYIVRHWMSRGASLCYFNVGSPVLHARLQFILHLSIGKNMFKSSGEESKSEPESLHTLLRAATVYNFCFASYVKRKLAEFKQLP